MEIDSHVPQSGKKLSPLWIAIEVVDLNVCMRESVVRLNELVGKPREVSGLAVHDSHQGEVSIDGLDA